MPNNIPTWSNDYKDSDEELISEMLAKRYANDVKAGKLCPQLFIPTAMTLKKTELQQLILPKDIQIGDKIIMDACILKQIGCQSQKEMKLDKEIKTIEIIVDGIWTEGTTIVIESGNQIYSTIDFSKHLAQEIKKLEEQEKTIEQIIADIGIERPAPTLLMTDLRFLDMRTKSDVAIQDLQDNSLIMTSGKQIADMSRPEWYANILISTPIIIEKVIKSSHGVAILAKDGPILTTIDCRPEFALNKAIKEQEAIERAIEKTFLKNKKVEQ